VYVVVSLLTTPTHPAVLAAWRRRTVEGAPEEFVRGRRVVDPTEG
jgi:SSS family solute:Na+ symporter